MARFFYTKEHLAFIASKYKKMVVSDVANLFNSRFGLNKTPSEIKSCISNHKIISGRTGCFRKGNVPHNAGTKGLMKVNSGSFKKGNMPLNQRPIGSERINRDGYIEVKTAEPRTWRLKHQIVWELNYGKIPPKHMIRMKDGDPSNVNIDNLFMVTQRENAILNKTYKVNQNPMELRDTLILLGRIDAKTTEAEAQV